MLLLSVLLACSSEQPEPKKEAPAAVEEQKADGKSKKEIVVKKIEPMDHGKDHHMGSVNVGEIPAEAKVFFVSPKDGETVKRPVTVQMGVEGMTVQPAGQIVPGTGHHHIIIDSEGVPKGKIVPADKQHVHFGKGQTETVLELEPGTHKLRLQFANGIHASYGEQLSSEITITVE